MKASELVEILNGVIADKGDLPVKIMDCNREFEDVDFYYIDGNSIRLVN